MLGNSAKPADSIKTAATPNKAADKSYKNASSVNNAATMVSTEECYVCEKVDCICPQCDTHHQSIHVCPCVDNAPDVSPEEQKKFEEEILADDTMDTDDTPVDKTATILASLAASTARQVELAAQLSSNQAAITQSSNLGEFKKPSAITGKAREPITTLKNAQLDYLRRHNNWAKLTVNGNNPDPFGFFHGAARAVLAAQPKNDMFGLGPEPLYTEVIERAYQALVQDPVMRRTHINQLFDP